MPSKWASNEVVCWDSYKKIYNLMHLTVNNLSIQTESKLLFHCCTTYDVKFFYMHFIRFMRCLFAIIQVFNTPNWRFNEKQKTKFFFPKRINKLHLNFRVEIINGFSLGVQQQMRIIPANEKIGSVSKLSNH